MKRRTSKRLAIAFLLWPVFICLLVVVPFYVVYFWLGQQSLERFFADMTPGLTFVLRAAMFVEFCLWIATVQYLFNFAICCLERFFPWRVEQMRNEWISFFLWDELNGDRELI